MNEALDQRIARWMVRPLVNTSVTANHLTTLRLLVGLIAVAGFTAGDYIWSNLAALGFGLSNLLDHTDGELARMKGQTSKWGHYYDLTADATIHILLFICIGIGLKQQILGGETILMGLLAGISVWSIFWFRMKIEDQEGKKAVQQPKVAGFEMEDILYFLPLITLIDGLKLFLALASTVAPCIAIFFGCQYLKLKKFKNQ